MTHELALPIGEWLPGVFIVQVATRRTGLSGVDHFYPFGGVDRCGFAAVKLTALINRIAIGSYTGGCPVADLSLMITCLLVPPKCLSRAAK